MFKYNRHWGTKIYYLVYAKACIHEFNRGASVSRLAGKLVRTEDVAKKAMLAASNGGGGRAMAAQLVDVERNAARLASQKAALERRLDS